MEPSRDVRVRIADLRGTDAAAVGRLVEAYLLQTELEKRSHLDGAPVEGRLAERYRAEVADPARAYAGATVLLAERDGESMGVAVVHPSTEADELKRLWVDPGARGHGAGSALLDAALRDRPRRVRLTVWEWRTDAIGLYRSRGFRQVASWDERERLLCFERRFTI